MKVKRYIPCYRCGNELLLITDKIHETCYCEPGQWSILDDSSPSPLSSIIVLSFILIIITILVKLLS